MHKLSAALLSAVAAAAKPFANTNAGSTLAICITPQNGALSEGAASVLTYVDIGGMGAMGEIGTSTSILTYDTWDTDVVDKGKGMSNAGDPTIEVARIADDPGQIALRAAALTNHKYAFRITRDDAPAGGGTPTMIYLRGLVTGPTRPMGRNESFDLEVFTLGLVQREIVVDAAAAP